MGRPVADRDRRLAPRPVGDDPPPVAYRSPIDLPAFFRGVMAPPEPDPDGAMERAESAGFRVTEDGYDDGVAELWETCAPSSWVDRRGGPIVFLGRRYPPMTTTSSDPRSSQDSFTYATYSRPTTLELAAALASNPDGVATCHALAEEAVERARLWYGDRAPKGVAWALMSPRWSQMLSTANLDYAEHKSLVRAGYRAVRGADYLDPDAGVWLEFGPGVSDASSKLVRSEEVARQGGETEATTWSNCLVAASSMLLLWSYADYAKKRGFVLPEPERSDRWAPDGFAGSRISDLPDALDPMLSIVGHGYMPFWMDRRFLVIGVPWNRFLVSGSRWSDIWEAPEDLSAMLF